jgi:hypothetical protein
LELVWWSFLSSRTIRVRLIIAKVRSQPACHVCASPTSLVDRVAQGIQPGDYEPDESPWLALFSVRCACIRSRLGGCELEGDWRRRIGPRAAESWALAVLWDSAIRVLDSAVVWRGVRPRISAERPRTGQIGTFACVPIGVNTDSVWCE